MMKVHDNGETCQRESFALLFFCILFLNNWPRTPDDLGFVG